jgi:hypothetical protein
MSARLLAVSWAMALVAIASPAGAQDAAASDLPTDAAGDAGGEEDLVASSGPEQDDEDPDEEDEEDEGLIFNVHVGPGEYQLRGNAMSDIPLQPGGPVGFRETPVPDRLGQNYFAEQWLRAGISLSLSDHRDASGAPSPFLTLFGQLDLLYGVAFGDLARGTAPSAYPRDDYGYPGIRLRQLYLEWRSPIGIFRVGQMTFSWGLGIVANDGQTPSPFGDYRFGDLVRRVLFATRPFGEGTPFVLALAGDWVAWDLTADGDRRCTRPGESNCGDMAFQGVLAGYYEEGENQIGAYFAYRTQHDYRNDFLDVLAVDVFGRWYFDEPTGGRFFAAAEVAYIYGATSLTRTPTRPRTDVEQLLAAVQVGRRESHLDVVFEGGYASGDSNTEDGVERRGTFDPDHRVGLVMFPEVIAMQTARAAFLAQDQDTFGLPSRGAQLLPTNGGVSGSYYLFPYAIWRPLDWIDVRLGAVLGWASTDVVDPYRQRAESRSVNYRGGDPARRDLGLEVDAAVRLRGRLTDWLEMTGGIEGGLMFPGHAFDDDHGVAMGEVGLVRLRVGLVF